MLWFAPVSMQAQSQYDQGKPFGFCTRTSRTSTSSSYAFNVTGGGVYSYPEAANANNSITLKSNGKDMRSEISDAISKYSVIIFDGSNGDFIVSKTISLSKLSNKTLLGINDARLCTQWHVTDEIKAALDKAGVPKMSTQSGTGGTLSTGSSISEEAELNTRQIIINLTGDTKESCRSCGVFSCSSCKNIIIRNLRFLGPGSIDISGADLISMTGCNNMWVDHCEFADGTDGNFDITQKSDFVTVSWCKFNYTPHSYMHQNTNLVGSSDSESTGYLNITFAYNNWGTGCRARMPMARVGLIHMLNNYYTCVGNATACINPRKNSEFLIEGNYFIQGVSNIFSQSDSKAWVWTATNKALDSWAIPPTSQGTVKVPYSYSIMDVNNVAEEVGNHAGATLFKETASAITIPTKSQQHRTVCYTTSGIACTANHNGIIISDGHKTIR